MDLVMVTTYVYMFCIEIFILVLSECYSMFVLMYTMNILAKAGSFSKVTLIRSLVKSAYQKIILLFLKQNICCGYSKELSQ